MTKIRIIIKALDTFDDELTIVDLKEMEKFNSCEEYYFSYLDEGEKRFVDTFSGGVDRNGKDIFVNDKLSIIGSSTIYLVVFDKVNLKYIGKASDGCTLSGGQFEVAKIEGNIHETD